MGEIDHLSHRTITNIKAKNMLIITVFVAVALLNGAQAAQLRVMAGDKAENIINGGML